MIATFGHARFWNSILDRTVMRSTRRFGFCHPEKSHSVLGGRHAHHLAVQNSKCAPIGVSCALQEASNTFLRKELIITGQASLMRTRRHTTRDDEMTEQ